MKNLDKVLYEWASKYADECSAGEYDYFDEDHFVQFLRDKIKELL